MRFYLSLTHRYALFVGIVILVLVIGSLVITYSVVRSAMTGLFEQRLERTSTVLDQYLSVRYYSEMNELRALLSSPRLFAALETGDPRTIRNEAPSYQKMLDAQLFYIADYNKQVFYTSRSISGPLLEIIRDRLDEPFEGTKIEYVSAQDEIFELFFSRIITPYGLDVGYIVSGEPFSGTLVTDLQHLSGFDVIVTLDSQILGFSSSELTMRMIEDKSHFRPGRLIQNRVVSTHAAGEDVVMLSLPSPFYRTTVTFLASLDSHINPIMEEVSFLLFILALGGASLATLTTFIYANRKIGRQVDLLVEAAERIAGGDLEGKIEPMTQDELGYLAGEFERMRSELSRNREALELSHQESIKSERLATIGQLVTGIIHDFKNPMAVINSTVDLIRVRDKQNEKLTRYCQTITDQVDRMVVLTRDLLEYSRGTTHLDVRVVNLADYFDDLRTFHLLAYQRHGLKLKLEGDPYCNVMIDPIRFRRVFDNILNNACDALKPGDRVLIQWNLDPDTLNIEVKDNGPGIPADIVDTVFDPFVSSGKESGTGLGLAIARKVVEDHGASITLSTSPGKGTTFSIALPRKMVVEDVSTITHA